MFGHGRTVEAEASFNIREKIAGAELTGMTTFTPFLAGQEIDLNDCVLVQSGRTRNVREHEALPGL